MGKEKRFGGVSSLALAIALLGCVPLIRVEGVEEPLPPRGDDTNGSMSSRGSLTADRIREVIRVRLSEVRVCYEAELLREPRLQGRVTMRWAINPSGSVRWVEVERLQMSPPYPATRFAQCVAERITTWVFPAPEGGGIVRVSYPFTLRGGSPAWL